MQFKISVFRLTRSDCLHISSPGFNPCFFLLKFSLWFSLHSCLIILRLFLMCSQGYMGTKPDKNKLQLEVQVVARELPQVCWVLALILSKQTSLLRVHPSQIPFYLKLSKLNNDLTSAWTEKIQQDFWIKDTWLVELKWKVVFFLK